MDIPRKKAIIPPTCSNEMFDLVFLISNSNILAILDIKFEYWLLKYLLQQQAEDHAEENFEFFGIKRIIFLIVSRRTRRPYLRS